MALSVAGEICLYLQAQSTPVALIYNAPGTVNLFDTFLPDVPDVAVMAAPRGGIAPVSIITGTPAPSGVTQPRLAFARPRVQILTRCAADGYDTGNSLAEAVFGALHGLNELFLNGGGHAYFHWIEAVQSPEYLGQTGGRDRHLWSQNFSVWWEDPALAV